MKNIVEKAKEQFLRMIRDYGKDPYGLVSHVNAMEKWAEYLLKNHPEADRETVLLGVWLHDIGHYPPKKNADHSVEGEKVAIKFLKKEGLNKKRISEVAHCIRAHRCKDVMPSSMEARIEPAWILQAI